MGREYTELGHLALERMERLTQSGYSSPELVPGGSLEMNVSDGVDYFDESDPEAIVRWEVAENSVPRGTKTIRVRVLARQAIIGFPKEAVLVLVRGR